MPSDGIHFLKEPHFYWPSLVAGEAELYIILAGYMAAQATGRLCYIIFQGQPLKFR